MTATDLSTLGTDWLGERFYALTDEIEVLSVSEWAERNRYLPPPNRFPGPFRFSVAPYMREIADCMSIDSPVREVSLMKGVQTTGTVGVLENAVGYYIDHVKTAAMMMVTADKELAQIRMESNVVPMLQASGLEHLIQSSDETNKRKTGRTDQKVEWLGGGFLIPLGAKNANKMRSIPIQILLRDEVDGWPDAVGKDGDPMQLTEDRTTSYEQTRKILDISTPLIEGSSKIKARFDRGDQRQYHVPCKHCGELQTIRWRYVDDVTGEVRGIVWETDDNGGLITESVRWLCAHCGGAHTNEDKIHLFNPDNGARWVPTATPVAPHVRSYHLSGLYSPVGFKSWAAQVQLWLEAWDESAQRPRDVGTMQVFYNNVLAQTWTVYGEKLRFSVVSEHRRTVYKYGEIPNLFARDYCGSPILLLTTTVDVQGSWLAVGVFGWTRDQRCILVDYYHWEGDPSQPDDAATWGKLRELIEETEYIADDGARYTVAVTLVDAQYLTDQVYSFAAQYAHSVYPIQGRDSPPRSANLKEFSEYTTKLGTRAFGITVDLYKDRWAARLRRSWDGMREQPVGHFNAPADVSDKALKELTAEIKREKKEAKSGRVIGYEWHRPGNARNELWDLLVYGNAALEMVMWDVCYHRLGLDFVNPEAFWEVAQNEALYYTAAK